MAQGSVRRSEMSLLKNLIEILVGKNPVSGHIYLKYLVCPLKKGLFMLYRQNGHIVQSSDFILICTVQDYKKAHLWIVIQREHDGNH